MLMPSDFLQTNRFVFLQFEYFTIRYLNSGLVWETSERSSVVSHELPIKDVVFSSFDLLAKHTLIAVTQTDSKMLTPSRGKSSVSSDNCSKHVTFFLKH